MPPIEPPDRPRDVLAAELFAMPTADPELHHGRVRLPEDPSGIAEAHDVLAAEEFAMPAPHPRAGIWASPQASGRTRATIVAAALLALVLLLRLLRRR